jgi:hypothetical protein
LRHDVDRDRPLHLSSRFGPDFPRNRNAATGLIDDFSEI